MSKNCAVCLAFLSAVVAPLLQGAAAAPKQPLGEIIGDEVYVNCQYHVAAHFPSEPKFRDITYRDGTHTAPARQFYVDSGGRNLSVTVVHFMTGPDQDPQLVKNAADNMRKRGDVHFDLNVFYEEPGIPGRQLDVGVGGGRVLRGSVYMVDQRLYITEAVSDPNDYPSFLFEESVSLIDEHGTDHDSNPVGLASDAPGTSAGLPPRQYDCSRINRRH